MLAWQYIDVDNQRPIDKIQQDANLCEAVRAIITHLWGLYFSDWQEAFGDEGDKNIRDWTKLLAKVAKGATQYWKSKQVELVREG